MINQRAFTRATREYDRRERRSHFYAPVANVMRSGFEDYKLKTRSFLRQRLTRFGETDEAIWGSRESHHKNFEALLGIGDVTNKSILDVGCGFGDLLDCLNKFTISSYSGVDISPEALAIAQRRHPGHKFETRDIHLNPFPPNSFDLVFASGIFALSYSLWEDYVQATMSMMFGFSRIGLAASFIERFADGSEISSCTRSGNVLNLLSHLTPRIKIHGGYAEGQYTVFLYK